MGNVISISRISVGISVLITPKDLYPPWVGPGGPAVVIPLFLLYDYTFCVSRRSAGIDTLLSERALIQ